MNYRHAYHAGNFADVLKHALLAWMVRYLQQKSGPLCLIDTHGGAGLYDLGGPEAVKTGEAQGGILRLARTAERPDALEPYFDLVQAANEHGPIVIYPGSPWLMARMLRDHDRAVIGELHSEEASALRAGLTRFGRVRIVEGDGYALLAKSVPPPEKRGLVLIDPPFESDDEFERLAAAVIGAHAKWPTGVYLVWHPSKDGAAIDRFHAELLNARIPKMTQVALDIGRDEGLSSCGLIAINAPWTMEKEWRDPLMWLAQAMACGATAAGQITMLAT